MVYGCWKIINVYCCLFITNASERRPRHSDIQRHLRLRWFVLPLKIFVRFLPPLLMQNCAIIIIGVSVAIVDVVVRSLRRLLFSSSFFSNVFFFFMNVCARASCVSTTLSIFFCAHPPCRDIVRTLYRKNFTNAFNSIKCKRL